MIPETVSPAGLRSRAEIMRGYMDESCARHLELAADKIDELESSIDRADEHTAFLMRSIAGLETRLKAAEYAAKVNYEGWQQEIARNEDSLSPQDKTEVRHD